MRSGVAAGYAADSGHNGGIPRNTKRRQRPPTFDSHQPADRPMCNHAMRAAKRAAEIKAVVDLAGGVIPGEDGDQFHAVVNGVKARAYRASGAWWADQYLNGDEDDPFGGWEYLPGVGPAPTGEAALRAAFEVLWPGVDLDFEETPAA